MKPGQIGRITAIIGVEDCSSDPLYGIVVMRTQRKSYIEIMDLSSPGEDAGWYFTINSNAAKPSILVELLPDAELVIKIPD